MLTTLRQTLLISYATTINAFVYFLKKIPLIKGLFKNVGYEHTNLTNGVFVAAIIVKVIKELLIRILLIAFGFGLPYMLIYKKASIIELKNVYWHLFICFYFLLPLLNTSILEPGKRKFICVKLMRMDAKKFVYADYFPAWFLRILLELPLFYLVSYLFDVELEFVFLLVIAKNMLAVFVEELHLIYFEKKEKFFHKKLVLVLGSALGFIVLGYFPAIRLKPFIFSMTSIIMVGLAGILLGLHGVRYLIHCKVLPQAIQEANKLNELVVNKEDIKKDSQFYNVKLKDKDISKEEIRREDYSKKAGFAFLNGLFFRRHKRILLRPIKLQMLVITIMFFFILIISRFIPDFYTKYIQVIKQSSAVFIFILYYMSTSQKATKAMFYNCDISLLHYGFYTSNQAVLTTFTVRVKYLIGTNLMPSLLLGGGLLLLDIFNGGSGLVLLPVCILIVVISVFFSIHNLFLYYIFQPYTTDLSIKNPLFTIFNVVTYFLSYLCLQLEGLPVQFLIGIIIVTALYSVIALVLVYRFAPKTFVIK